MGCFPSSRVVPVFWREGALSTQSGASIEEESTRESRQLNRQQFLRLRIARDILRDYTVVGLIGKGAFSQVLKVIENKTGQCYAMKVVNRRDFFPNSVEMDVLRKLSSPSHPNLISLHNFLETSGQVYMLTDLAEGGDLFEWLLNHGKFQEHNVRRFTIQVLHGVQHLHEHAVLHRDIKLENVFVKRRSWDTELMLGDFGLAYVFSHGAEAAVRGACGTLEYQAPEAILGKTYSYPVDIWAVGVMMYALLFGQLPFTHNNDMTLRDFILYGQYKQTGQVRLH